MPDFTNKSPYSNISPSKIQTVMQQNLATQIAQVAKSVHPNNPPPPHQASNSPSQQQRLAICLQKCEPASIRSASYMNCNKTCQLKYGK